MTRIGEVACESTDLSGGAAENCSWRSGHCWRQHQPRLASLWSALCMETWADLGLPTTQTGGTNLQQMWGRKDTTCSKCEVEKKAREIKSTLQREDAGDNVWHYSLHSDYMITTSK